MSLSRIDVSNWPIAPSNCCALALTVLTPSTFVACVISLSNAVRCALLMCVNVPNVCFAAALASFNLASPFNAVLVLFTFCNACSTAALSTFWPLAFVKIAFAAFTAWS